MSITSRTNESSLKDLGDSLNQSSLDGFVIVAIDGEAASGKSSTARKIAEQFNFLYVDTGAHYRAFTFHFLRANIHPNRLDLIENHIQNMTLDTEVRGYKSLMRINGSLVSESDLRSFDVNKWVSHFAAIFAIRNCLLRYQRDQVRIAIEHGFDGVVIEGRDIGSVVFPKAHCRFFLFAHPQQRAQRREKEGHQDSIVERDQIDIFRKHAPLHCADGALSIDTTEISLEEVSLLVASQIDALKEFKKGAFSL